MADVTGTRRNAKTQKNTRLRGFRANTIAERSWSATSLTSKVKNACMNKDTRRTRWSEKAELALERKNYAATPEEKNHLRDQCTVVQLNRGDKWFVILNTHLILPEKKVVFWHRCFVDLFVERRKFLCVRFSCVCVFSPNSRTPKLLHPQTLKNA